MKKLLSLLTVAALMLCLLSTSAFATLIRSNENGDGIVGGYTQRESTGTATIIDPSGTIVNPPNQGYGYTGGTVVVTKNPTGEKVEKGGSAIFTAYASNGAIPTWRLVSSDTLETIYAAGANQHFDNLVIEGAHSNRLTLKNIGDNMNGWQVEAMFDDGQGGHVFSTGARITVIGSTANGTTTDKNPYARTVGIGGNGNAPSINGQPTGAELTSGKSTTLSVTAGTNVVGAALKYQWYVSKDAELTNPQAIAGATSASYTPGELPGTRYYFCEVWSETKDANGETVKSETVKSDAVAVTYPESTPAPTPSAAPSPTPSPVPTSSANAGNTGSNTGSNTESGSGSNTGSNPIVAAPTDPGTEVQPSPEAQTAKGNTTAQVDTDTRSSLPVILGAIAAVALAAGVGLLVLRRNAGQ